MAVAPLAPEIIWLNSSESYLEDPVDTLDLMDKSSSGHGLLGTYYGFDEQDPSVGVWVMAWDSLATHQSFMEHESYIDFALPVMEAMIGSGDISQVLLSQQSAFLKAVSSPVTQFIYITLRPRHDRDYELEPLVEKLTGELALVPGCYGSSWGPSMEHDDMYVGVIGWRCISVRPSLMYLTAFPSFSRVSQDRDRAVKGALAPTVAQIRELGSVELKYARLQLHESPES